jgi:pimeloyl-ACP methyl ester carboxylesterase
VALIRALAALLVLSIECERGARPVADASDAAPVGELRDAPSRGLLDRDAWSPEASTIPTDAALGMLPIAPQPLFTNLVVPSFSDPVVSVPNGATSLRPIVVVLHGASDRPDWNCDAWRHITDAHGFILCPRGDYDPRESTVDDRRYTLRGGAHLHGYVQAALDALAVRFAGYVDVERPIVAGFSLGASEIAQLALSDPGRFPRVALLEGGHDVWTHSSIAAFAAQGGSRVLFGCGSAWCLPPARAAARRLNLGGVPARVVFAAVGHTNDRPLQEALMAELAWFLDGDPRWTAEP